MMVEICRGILRLVMRLVTIEARVLSLVLCRSCPAQSSCISAVSGVPAASREQLGDPSI